VTWRLDGRDLVNDKAGVRLICTPSGHTLDHPLLTWSLETTINGRKLRLPIGRRWVLNDTVAEMRKRSKHDTRRSK